MPGQNYISKINGLEISASYAVTASYALNSGTPGGPNKSIQFNSDQTFSGSSNFTFDSASNALTLTGSLNVSGSTIQVGNNNLLGNTTLSGSIIISGALGTNNPTVRVYGDVTHDGYVRFDPVSTNIDNSISASYIYVSGSTNDLYFTQNGQGYGNTTRLRWLEGNLYTGLLHGGIISATVGGTTFNISSGSGIIVNLNASLTTDPYPTIKFINWGNFTNQSINNLATAIQTFLGIDSNGQIIQQTTPWNDGQYNESISLGTVIHQNLSTVNATITYPNVAYGYKQRTYDFIKAFGPLKLSGYTLYTSSSLGLTVGSGSAFADGRNYQTDPNNPSYITDNGTAVSKIFRYYQSGSSFVQDTNAGAGYTGIDTTQYNLNGSGSLVSTSGGKYYAQRIFWYPNSATKGIVVYYGLAEYNSLDEAQADYTQEPFLETPNTQQNAIFLGVIFIRGNGSFSTPSDYRIIQASLFRAAGTGGGGGGGGGGATTLGALTDVQLGTLTDKQSLVYDLGSSKWVNSYTLSGSLAGTAATASYVSGSVFTSTNPALSASYASTASFLPVGTYQITSSWATNALTASLLLGSVTSASYAATASYVNPLKQNVIITGSLVVSGSGATIELYGDKIIAGAVGGDEGGEILLGKPITNTTLTGSGITIDSYQNKIRFFEQGGAARGAYIDLTACGAGVGTNLLSDGVSFLGSGSIITGSTAISSSYGLYVPANTFTVGNIVKVQGVFTKPNAASSMNFYIYINTSNSLSGATQLALFQTTTQRWNPITRTLAIESSTSTTLHPTNVSHYNDDIVLVGATARASVNINWAADQYILFAAQNASTGDRTDTFRFYAKKIWY